VDQLGRAAARPACEIAALEEEDAQPAQGRVPRDRGALDAAADNEEVVWQSASLPWSLLRAPRFA